ncbi:MAG: helicase HerA-like domain-containing protein [Miltoncostaeaceae bacterium]
MAEAYGFEGPTIRLGRPYPEPEEIDTQVEVGIPLGLLNRHGLIAGATGTGKTKTLQLMAEQISAAGCPVFAADMKGDLAGIARPGEASDPVKERVEELDQDWQPVGAPVELMSLTGQEGVALRASVSAFGPDLLSKVMDLNETQTSSLSLIFRFCEEGGLPLIELEDLRAALAYLVGPGKDDLGDLGGVSKATVGVIQRKVSELEGDGGDAFFGEPEFDIAELFATAEDGRGIVSVLDLTGVATQPKLFSTFLMWVLGELFADLPEVGDPDKPELVFFFDEAHLLFDDASDAFLDAVAQTVRLIRSKGVGVFFVTQLPTDLPEEVLSQLGHRVQHAVRAFTPKDARALKAAVDTFPITEHYDLEETLTQLGVGEAAVTVLDERGVPTAVAATRLYAPASRMSPLTEDERDEIIDASELFDKYEEPVDRESAEEMLAAKLAGDRERAAKVRDAAARDRSDDATPRRTRRKTRSTRRRKKSTEEQLLGQATKFLKSRQGQKVVRDLLGMLRR